MNVYNIKQLYIQYYLYNLDMLCMSSDGCCALASATVAVHQVYILSLGYYFPTAPLPSLCLMFLYVMKIIQRLLATHF